MPKCEITLRHGCFPVNLLHIFRLFLEYTSGRLFVNVAQAKFFILLKRSLNQVHLKDYVFKTGW